MSRLETRCKGLELRTKGDGRGGEAEGSQTCGAWEGCIESPESQRCSERERSSLACILGDLSGQCGGHIGQGGG